MRSVHSIRLLAILIASLLALSTATSSWLTPTAFAVIGPCIPTFAQPAGSPFSVGNYSAALAVGDFNGDGRADLATANIFDVSVLLGNGSGGFTAGGGATYSGTFAAFSIAVGDFDGDDREDLAVTDYTFGTVSIFLGDGSGGFSEGPGSPYLTGSGAGWVAVHDFNGDGHQDLVVTNEGSDNAVILLGTGSGSFFPHPGSPIPAGDVPGRGAIGDFNGDGDADLAIPAWADDTVVILFGDGAGGFAPSGAPVSVGNGPIDIASSDINGDGDDDLAVANRLDNTVTILLGNGSGGFTPAGAPIGTGLLPDSLAITDFNGDGNVDIAGVNQSSDTVGVLLGNGSGGFTPLTGSPFAVGDQPEEVVVGDFNGDGDDDLAIVSALDDAVTVLLNACLSANLAVSGSSSPNPVMPGASLTYSLTAQNLGPDPASTVSLSMPLPANTTFTSLVAPGGWTCNTPGIGSHGTVECTTGAFAVTSVSFTLVTTVAPNLLPPATLQLTASIDATTADPSGTNNSATVTTSVGTATATPTPTPSASTPQDEKEDDRPKETEEQKQQRERTNRSGRDDYATEGNVVAVDAASNPPTITIANRDGRVLLVWVGPRDHFPTVKVGDYVQVDGEKIHEQLYEITDASVD